MLLKFHWFAFAFAFDLTCDVNQTKSVVYVNCARYSYSFQIRFTWLYLLLRLELSYLLMHCNGYTDCSPNDLSHKNYYNDLSHKNWWNDLSRKTCWNNMALQAARCIHEDSGGNYFIWNAPLRCQRFKLCWLFWSWRLDWNYSIGWRTHKFLEISPWFSPFQGFKAHCGYHGCVSPVSCTWQAKFLFEVPAHYFHRWLILKSCYSAYSKVINCFVRQLSEAPCSHEHLSSLASVCLSTSRFWTHESQLIDGLDPLYTVLLPQMCFPLQAKYFVEN